MVRLGAKAYNRPIGRGGGSKGEAGTRRILSGLYFGKPRPLSYSGKSKDQQNGEVKIIKPANKE